MPFNKLQLAIATQIVLLASILLQLKSCELLPLIATQIVQISLNDGRLIYLIATQIVQISLNKSIKL
jgi:chromatin segregation and condensation protein Rec8/ScpA/Scc1 (kleisin family)